MVKYGEIYLSKKQSLERGKRERKRRRRSWRERKVKEREVWGSRFLIGLLNGIFIFIYCISNAINLAKRLFFLKKI